jgi:iron complex outermembrane receptor protein
MELLEMKRGLLTVAAFFLLPLAAAAQVAEGGLAQDLTEMPIERLLDLEVTSVSKREQKLSEAAAAIFVVTQEDIRRSGATSIPEVLRMVPGVEVGRIDANKWAVTIRGFNDRFANKLLVLIDGRSIYTPLFSGVFWEAQDTLLEDIDRIEVIRGPGATLWGANAVNGVINILTKSAKETHGLLLSAGGGTEERGFGGLRFGGGIGEKFHYRTYAKFFKRDEGFGGIDDWWHARAGVRTDWEISDRDTLTLQGDFYDGDHGWRATEPTLVAPFSVTGDADFEFTGGNVLGRWTHRFNDRIETVLQSYYDRGKINGFGFRENRHTFDLDFQNRIRIGGRQDLVWGAEYRLSRDNILNSGTVSFTPDSRDQHLFSGFVQDEISIVPGKLRFTVGSKFEHNTFSGFEYQPTARLIWLPHERHTLWASFSRAVKTPSRTDEDVRVNLAALPDPTTGSTVLVALLGNRNVKSEVLFAGEVGYRVRPTDRLFFDLTAYFNRINDLVTRVTGAGVPEADPAPAHTLVPLNLTNQMDANVIGAELAADWQVLEWWRLRLAYTFLDVDLNRDPGSGANLVLTQGGSPKHQVSLFSTMDLPKNLELDWWFRFVDRLPGIGIDRYATLDVRLGWKPVKNLELSVVGQNLLDNHRPEFVSQTINTQPTEVERAVYGKILWRFP